MYSGRRVFIKEQRKQYLFTRTEYISVCLICNDTVSLCKVLNRKSYFAPKHHEYCAHLSLDARTRKTEEMVFSF